MAKNDIFGTKPRDKKGIVVYKKNSKLYGDMKLLSRKERGVLDYIVANMAEDLNTIIIAGLERDTLLADVDIDTRTLSNMISKLKSLGFIDKTILAHEYVVNPMLAYSGNYNRVMNNYNRYENELRASKGFKTI